MAKRRKKNSIVSEAIVNQIRLNMREVNKLMRGIAMSAPGDFVKFDYWTRRCGYRYASKVIFKEAVQLADPSVPQSYCQEENIEELYALMFMGIEGTIEMQKTKQLPLENAERARLAKEWKDVQEYERATGKKLI